MTQAAIEALLKHRVGLDPEIIGSSAIAKAVEQRFAASGLSERATYLTRLQTSRQEFAALVEQLVVPETWFFRDREPFAYLKHYVQQEWLVKRPEPVLRVLSLPCSTGEEPYSIAITLCQIGLTAKDFRIDAVDISQKALDHAQRALYSPNAFRGNPPSFQTDYFTKTGAGYQLQERIRTVNFKRGNLLEPLPFGDRPYRVIFCRNLLIYFTPAARKQAIQTLDHLLAEGGLLFVGHSEVRQLSQPRFVPVRHPLAFAFQKVLTPQASIEQSVSPVVPQSIVKRANGQHQFNTAPLTLDNSETTLESAKALADQGQLGEAIARCEAYLSQNRISAEAYVLLGQLHQATGDEAQAEACFQKAIYLAPTYYEALIHLALLQEHHGDLRNAAITRQRVQRLKG